MDIMHGKLKANKGVEMLESLPIYITLSKNGTSVIMFEFVVDLISNSHNSTKQSHRQEITAM